MRPRPSSGSPGYMAWSPGCFRNGALVSVLAVPVMCSGAAGKSPLLLSSTGWPSWPSSRHWHTCTVFSGEGPPRVRGNNPEACGKRQELAVCAPSLRDFWQMRVFVVASVTVEPLGE